MARKFMSRAMLAVLGLITGVAHAAALPAAALPAEAEPQLLGLDAEGWVYAGITIFFVLVIVVAKGHRRIASALDARIAETRAALDEAAQIRAEAETLLAAAQHALAASEDDAKAILELARGEAEALIARAERDTAAIIARREGLATAKIATAERAAIDRIRARVARGAVLAATATIAANHNAEADQPLINAAIAGL